MGGSRVISIRPSLQYVIKATLSYTALYNYGLHNIIGQSLYAIYYYYCYYYYYYHNRITHSKIPNTKIV